MRIKMLITFLLVVIILVACSPVATPIALVLPTPPPTPIALVLPTPPPTPILFPCDSNNRYTFYAYDDGYDSMIGNGYLLLKAGYSYTFEIYCNPEQVEVRLISNDQLLGYALLIMTYDSNGSFTGYEKPSAIVDSNGDELVSIQELDTALGLLSEKAKVIAEIQPSFAAKFEADIASAYTATNSGAIADVYRKIKQLQIELTYVEQAVKDQAATPVSLAQEAQIRPTQQAEFDEKCNSPEIRPEEESTISLLEIDFWPEYDRPSMLVIYRVTLSSHMVSLPTDLTFRIPSTAGEPNAVAIQDNSGALLNVDYSRIVRSEWAYISFTTSSTHIQLEYYDPNLVIVGNSRHFEYQWQDDYPVDNLFIRVQQPSRARRMQLSPEMYGPGLLEDGMNYYCTNLGTTTNQYTSLITIDYELDDSP